MQDATYNAHLNLCGVQKPNHFNIVSANKEDFAAQAVIDRVQKSIVKDDIKEDGKGGPITLEAYLEVLRRTWDSNKALMQ